MLDIILDAGTRALSKVLLPSEMWTLASTFGTLTACKLIVRLHNGGAGAFAGEPIVWEQIERLSDRIAIANAHRLGDATPDAKVVPGLRQAGPGAFLGLVRTRTTFQWCPVTFDMHDSPPIDSEPMMAALPYASKVWWAIYKSVGLRRVSHPSNEDRANTIVAELAAAGAAAKLFLALWGNGTTAAFLELLAADGSGEQYQCMLEDMPEDSEKKSIVQRLWAPPLPETLLTSLDFYASLMTFEPAT